MKTVLASLALSACLFSSAAFAQAQTPVNNPSQLNFFSGTGGANGNGQMITPSVKAAAARPDRLWMCRAYVGTKLVKSFGVLVDNADSSNPQSDYTVYIGNQPASNGRVRCEFRGFVL